MTMNEEVLSDFMEVLDGMSTDQLQTLLAEMQNVNNTLSTAHDHLQLLRR